MLNEIRLCSEDLDFLLEQRQEMITKLTNATGNIDRQPRGRKGNPFDALVILDDQIDRKFSELVTLQVAAFHWMYQCNDLTSIDRCIILDRYFMGKSWDQIANSLGVSLQTCYRSKNKIKLLVKGCG